MKYRFIVANYSSGFTRFFSTKQKAINQAELIGGEVYEVKRQIKYEYLGYPQGLKIQKRRQNKRIDNKHRDTCKCMYCLELKDK